MVIIALMLGFAGSLHCLGMCSPLMMAATSVSSKGFGIRVLYNLGRLLTYGIAGAVITGFGAIAGLSGFQFVFTLVAGITMILMGIAGTSGLRIPLVSSAISRFTGGVKAAYGSFLSKRTPVSLFALGMLNGLLPCGLTFFALTYCLTLVGPTDGFLFMILFGLGTMPAMLGVTVLFSLIIRKTGWNLASLGRYTLVLTGAIVLARLLFVHHGGISTATRQVIMLCQ